MRGGYHYDFLVLSGFARTSRLMMQLGRNRSQRCTKDKSLRRGTARRRAVVMQTMAFGDIFFAGVLVVWVLDTGRGARVWLRVTVLQGPLSLPSQSLQSPRP